MTRRNLVHISREPMQLSDAVTAGARQLWHNPNPTASIGAWPMQHPIEASLAWSALILAVAAPLASGLFRRRTTE